MRRANGRLVILLGAAIAAMSAGCPMYRVTTRPVPEAKIGTPGVAIWDKDSAFRMDAGRPFPTPFYAEGCLPHPTVRDYAAARRLGARPVVVQVPGLPQPIYGLLAFCRVPVDATGPAAREYLVVVPEDRVSLTADGAITLKYEQTNYEDLPAWELWLSRSPSLWQ